MKNINSAFRNFWNNDDGQDLVEYSLLLSFVALGSLGLLYGAKSTIFGWWSKMDTTLNAAS